MSGKLIASDYDGTLHYKNDLDPRDLAAIERWRKNGNYFALISGRQNTFLEYLISEKLPLDFIVLTNGAQGFLPSGRLAFESTADGALVPQLIDIVRSQNIDFFESDLKNGVFHQFTARTEDEPGAQVFTDAVNKQFFRVLTAFRNGRCIDIVPRGVDKGKGVARVADFFGVEKENVYTVGDNNNDLPMLTAFHGFAVECALDEVKAAVESRCRDIADMIEILS